MNDKQRLMELALAVRSDLSANRLRELYEHVTRCQNDCTCDGTVGEEVWLLARDIHTQATQLLARLDRMQFLRH